MARVKVKVHPDPLLGRLRLRDSKGKAMLDPGHPSSELRDAVVIGFLFGSEVDTSRYGRELYQDLVQLSRANPHRFKIIYVSFDPDERSYAASTSNKPWLSMVWDDGAALGAEDEAARTANDEEFIYDLSEDDQPSTHATPAKNSNYLRPYSRTALAQKFKVLSIPHFAVYHLPTGKVISDYVRPIEFRSDKRDSTMEAWMEGTKGPNGIDFPGYGEIFHRMRWTIAVACIAIIYHVVRSYAGPQYDIMNLLQKIFVPKELQDPPMV